jgi:hypothetical protein
MSRVLLLLLLLLQAQWSELWCWQLCWQDAEALLAGDALPTELVIWGEACWVGRLGGGAVRGDLLQVNRCTPPDTVIDSQSTRRANQGQLADSVEECAAGSGGMQTARTCEFIAHQSLQVLCLCLSKLVTWAMAAAGTLALVGGDAAPHLQCVGPVTFIVIIVHEIHLENTNYQMS